MAGTNVHDNSVLHPNSFSSHAQRAVSKGKGNSTSGAGKVDGAVKGSRLGSNSGKTENFTKTSHTSPVGPNSKYVAKSKTV